MIIAHQFEAFAGRVTVVGPPIMLNAKVAQMFALIVHELATNASKLGALSDTAGVIDIGWSIEGAGAGGRFKFRWEEHGGPPVSPPTRHGFGRSLLEKAVAQEFGAPPVIRFVPGGLDYEIDAPLSAVEAEALGAAPRQEFRP